jgi:hypothetical protein
VLDNGNLGILPSAILLAIGGLALLIVQYLKFSRMPDRWGPYAVLLVSVVLVGLWIFQAEINLRKNILGFVFDVMNIAANAAGFYGFARSVGPSGLMRTHKPPSGAMDAPTGKV